MALLELKVDLARVAEALEGIRESLERLAGPEAPPTRPPGGLESIFGPKGIPRYGQEISEPSELDSGEIKPGTWGPARRRGYGDD